MYTMNRCTTTFFSRPLARRLVAGLALALLGATLPATAQVVPGLGGMRNFPDAALRGTLTLNSLTEATLNGRSIRMAPGMRLLSPQNTLVMLHGVLGQSYKVNYVIENSTGMLLTAWILSNAEAAQKRAGSDSVQSNFTFESDATPAR